MILCFLIKIPFKKKNPKSFTQVTVTGTFLKLPLFLGAKKKSFPPPLSFAKAT